VKLISAVVRNGNDCRLRFGNGARDNKRTRKAVYELDRSARGFHCDIGADDCRFGGAYRKHADSASAVIALRVKAQLSLKHGVGVCYNMGKRYLLTGHKLLYNTHFIAHRKFIHKNTSSAFLKKSGQRTSLKKDVYFLQIFDIW
jgi:hypothetical protein